MHRRFFLLGIGGGAAALVARRESSAKDLRGVSISATVKNITQAFREKPLPLPGTVLTLQIDRRRTYDPRSVSVSTFEGNIVGYLPPVQGRTIEALLSGPLTLKASVIESRAEPRHQMKIAIHLQPTA